VTLRVRAFAKAERLRASIAELKERHNVACEKYECRLEKLKGDLQEAEGERAETLGVPADAPRHMGQ
jgi:hypothetical protein